MGIFCAKKNNVIIGTKVPLGTYITIDQTKHWWAFCVDYLEEIYDLDKNPVIGQIIL